MPPKGPKGAPPGKSGGKKAPAAMIAKLKARMDLQQAEEERFKKEQEEEERRIKEEERIAREQEKYEEEQKRIMKERLKEEQKIEKQKAKSAVKVDVLERIRASGAEVPDVDKIREAEKEGGGNIYMKKKKPKGHANPNASSFKHKKEVEESEEESEESDGEKTTATISDEEAEFSDWEMEAAHQEIRDKRHEVNLKIREKREIRAKAREERKKAREERKRLQEEQKAAEALEKAKQRSLRSPICCVLGHVDTGKTSLLDRIRRTNVQGGEAGGITQQIGATFFPAERLLKATEELRDEVDLKVPGLLVIDTPGHESFTNLRNRGGSICDIAVLVVDIMHGLENQTRESIRILRERKCPFIVALNKVDRLFDWEPHENMPFQKTLDMQKNHVKIEFESRSREVMTQLLEEGLNSELYYRNTEIRKFVSIVPTSAHSGEGICDLLMLEIKLVQEYMKDKVTLRDELECVVLEVKPITGLGFTIDCILINGELNEKDTICLCGQFGPIFTEIRSILTPQPMKEMRVRSEYVNHKNIKAAMGIKICAADLEDVVPGTPLIVVNSQDERGAAAQAVMSDAKKIDEMIDKDGIGVTVQSSSLGALEALLSFLKDMKIPVGSANVGTIQKRHLYHAILMKRKNPRYAVVLAFDVTVAAGAKEMVDKEEIKIFHADIIYHLFDAFTLYNAEYTALEKERLRDSVVFPVLLEVSGSAFHASAPMIIPVRVKRGQLRVGTPLCTTGPQDLVTTIGKVMSMEKDGNPVEKATEGMEISVKISTNDSGATFGREVQQKSELVSQISRASVNAVKKFKDELSADDALLLAALVKILKIPKE